MAALPSCFNLLYRLQLYHFSNLIPPKELNAKFWIISVYKVWLVLQPWALKHTVFIHLSKRSNDFSIFPILHTKVELKNSPQRYLRFSPIYVAFSQCCHILKLRHWVVKSQGSTAHGWKHKIWCKDQQDLHFPASIWNQLLNLVTHFGTHMPLPVFQEVETHQSSHNSVTTWPIMMSVTWTLKSSQFCSSGTCSFPKTRCSCLA